MLSNNKIVRSNSAVRFLSNPRHALAAGPDLALAIGANHLRGDADRFGESPLLCFGLFEPLGKLHPVFIARQ